MPSGGKTKSIIGAVISLPLKNNSMSDEPNRCVCSTCGYTWHEHSNSDECDFCTAERLELELEEDEEDDNEDNED